MILDPSSLMKTVDNINTQFLLGKVISPDEKLAAAIWIVSQQGKKGAYRSMFAPTAMDFNVGIRLFTGERLVSASARHIMGQEAARATWLLGTNSQEVREMYAEATHWMHDNPEFEHTGTFCCGRCTLAYWRHFWVGNFENKEERMLKGLRALNNARLGDGRWQRYPFYYTIYTLTEIDLEPAKEELRYARPVIQKYLKKNWAGVYPERRAIIMQKALENIN